MLGELVSSPTLRLIGSTNLLAIIWVDDGFISRFCINEKLCYGDLANLGGEVKLNLRQSAPRMKTLLVGQ